MIQFHDRCVDSAGLKVLRDLRSNLSVREPILRWRASQISHVSIVASEICIEVSESDAILLRHAQMIKVCTVHCGA